MDCYASECINLCTGDMYDYYAVTLDPYYDALSSDRWPDPVPPIHISCPGIRSTRKPGTRLRLKFLIW